VNNSTAVQLLTVIHRPWPSQRTALHMDSQMDWRTTSWCQ